MTKETIQEIAEKTNINDHTGALMILAADLGRLIHLRTLKSIEAIHRDVGHMPYHLGLFRSDIAFQLRDIAKKEYDAETFAKIMEAF